MTRPVQQDPPSGGSPKSRFESWPQEVRDHFHREFAAEREPGWLERHHAELEEHALKAPRRARKR